MTKAKLAKAKKTVYTLSKTKKKTAKSAKKKVAYSAVVAGNVTISYPASDNAGVPATFTAYGTYAGVSTVFGKIFRHGTPNATLPTYSSYSGGSWSMTFGPLSALYRWDLHVYTDVDPGEPAVAQRNNLRIVVMV